jgi:integrase
MRHRQDCRDFGLVFAKKPSDAGRRSATVFGTPLPTNNLGEREFAALVKAANVRPITIHGLRHTGATLLLAAGVPSHVVQKRLGHKDASTTLDVTATYYPTSSAPAARKLAALLYGK